MKQMSRILTVWGVVFCMMLLTGCSGMIMKIAASKLGLPAPAYKVQIDKNVIVPMRDGIQLAADIYRPAQDGKFPVVICRTPYGKNNPGHKYDLAGSLFASQGFVFICQDVRGKHNSEGEYYPYIHEGADGIDTFDWAAGQVWSNENVGTYGFSYWGSTQWLSAPLGSAHLKSMIPIVTGQNLYRRWIYNGVFRINDVLAWHWANAEKHKRSEDEVEAIDWNTAVMHLPLIEADDALGRDISYYNDWINHPQPGPYWDQINVDQDVSEITAPALIIDGWYDYYLDWAIEDYNRMRTSGKEGAKKSQMIIGPWTHTSTSKFKDVDFGKQAGFMQRIKDIMAWHRFWLTGEETGIQEQGPIKIFVMGKNEWRVENEWPLARTRFTRYYLHSNGSAGVHDGDGELGLNRPGDEPADRYLYDPADPTPNIGGTTIYGNQKAGPLDQAPLYSRKDVLYYTSPPLEEAVEVTGPVALTLFASSTARDTDFAATLVDVYPDGKAVNIKTGLLRARFRKSLSEPLLLEENKVYPYEIRIGNTSNLFKAGHRIRIQVTSAYFPEFGRNLNTGAPIGQTAETVVAEQKVHHDSNHASHVLLPFIPR